jgi:hypothetical protein
MYSGKIAVPPGGDGIVKKLLNIFAALPNCQSTGGVSIEMAKPVYYNSE